MAEQRVVCVDPPEMIELALTVPLGSRWCHLNTGDVWTVVMRAGGRLDVACDERQVWVWPDYLTSPSNFERLADHKQGEAG